jgi:hypothetical protein
MPPSLALPKIESLPLMDCENHKDRKFVWCLWVFKYTLNLCAFSCKILIVAATCYATERASMLLMPKPQLALPAGMDGSAPPINLSRN